MNKELARRERNKALKQRQFWTRTLITALVATAVVGWVGLAVAG